MKSYPVESGVRGLLGSGEWMLFASESDYIEYCQEEEE